MTRPGRSGGRLAAGDGRRPRRRAATVVVLTLSWMVLAAPVGLNAAAPDREDAVETFARDVYVVDRGSLQNPTGDTPSDAPLYNVSGAPLDLTWGRWREGSATSVMHTLGGQGGRRTAVALRMERLIPGGIYSVFYGTFAPDSRHPLCPNAERTLPLTAVHPERQMPDPSSFVAGPDGAAAYRGLVDGSLLDATQVFVSIVYHADRRTYHPMANRGEWFTQGGDDCRTSYGDDAMRHVVVLQKW